MARVAHLFRHPIKSHGVESLDRVTLEAGKTMPFDRRWAVAHDAAKTDGSAWSPCRDFSRAAKAPELIAVTSRLHEDGRTITLSHPKRKDFTFQPDDPRQLTGFLAWSKPLLPANRAGSDRIVRVDGRGMTDTPFPSISINSLSALKALSEKAGQDISPLRFRGNIWLDGLDAWSEFDWIDKTIRIGTAELTIRERIGRCMATTANPKTGARDLDTLGLLQSHWGHQDFGIYATVETGGTIQLGDSLEVL